MGETERKPPLALLQELGAALDACEKAGVNLKITKFGVISDIGYVLPVENGWVVRTREFTPFSPPGEED